MKKAILITIFIFLFFPKPVLAVDQNNQQEAYIRLNEGWNLYSQSLVTSSKPLMASDLIKSMNAQGGLVSTVSRWLDGKYEDYVLRTNGEVYGTNFPIELGKSYFVRNYKVFNYHIAGDVVNTWKVQLQPGYNFVGVPSAKEGRTISTFANAIQSVGASSPEISRFFSGLFQTYAVKNGQGYGDDFKFSRFGAYIVKVDNNITLDF